MRLVNMLAQVDLEKCTGCKTCEKICPTLAIKIVNRKAIINPDKCRSCNNCQQRCPVHAITMVKLEKPFKVFVDPTTENEHKIKELCEKARFNTEQIICYCTETRAEEIAAAILKGYDTPEKLSLFTGIRTGCKVECIQPILRLLEAAGIKPEKPEGGWQWYGRTPTVWDIPEDVKARYSKRGFYFDNDIALLDKVAETKGSSKEDDKHA